MPAGYCRVVRSFGMTIPEFATRYAGAAMSKQAAKLSPDFEKNLADIIFLGDTGGVPLVGLTQKGEGMWPIIPILQIL
jgi:hypothetical protein